MCVCTLPGPYRAWCSGSDRRDPGRAASTSSRLTSWSSESSSAPSSPSTITSTTKTTTMPPESPRGASGGTLTTTSTRGLVCAAHSFLFGVYFRRASALLLSLYLGRQWIESSNCTVVKAGKVWIGRNNTGVWLEHKESEVRFFLFFFYLFSILGINIFFTRGCWFSLLPVTDQMHRFLAYHVTWGRFLTADQLSAKCIGTFFLVFSWRFFFRGCCKISLCNLNLSNSRPGLNILPFFVQTCAKDFFFCTSDHCRCFWKTAKCV